MEKRRTTQRLETKNLDIHRCLLKVCSAIVVLDEVDDVDDGEHAREARVITVPERGRDDAWVDEKRKRQERRTNTVEKETLKSLLDGELCIEDDEPE